MKLSWDELLGAHGGRGILVFSLFVPLADSSYTCITWSYLYIYIYILGDYSCDFYDNACIIILLGETGFRNPWVIKQKTQ